MLGWFVCPTVSMVITNKHTGLENTAQMWLPQLISNRMYSPNGPNPPHVLKHCYLSTLQIYTTHDISRSDFDAVQSRRQSDAPQPVTRHAFNREQSPQPANQDQGNHTLHVRSQYSSSKYQTLSTLWYTLIIASFLTVSVTWKTSNPGYVQ